MPAKFIDLTGKRFERLVVDKYIGKNKFGVSMWLCNCDCGNKKEINYINLVYKRTKSCGCYRIKHGHSNDPTYCEWVDMRRRCYDKNNGSYEHYGERGITVCDRWNPDNGGSFANFLKDMGEYTKGMSIDRIDNNNDYFLKNCRRSTPKEQTRNRRNTKIITYNIKTQCLQAWADEYKINYYTLWTRIYKYGWSIEKAFTTPVKKRRLLLVRNYEIQLRSALKSLKSKRINFSKYLPYNNKQLHDHLENIIKSQNNSCPMCHKSYNEIKYDIDHIIPTSSAKTKEELLKLFDLENLSLLCFSCNRYVKKDNVVTKEINYV